MEQATYTSWPRCGVLLLAHCHRKPHMHPLCSLGPGPPPFHLVLETGYVSVASFAIHMHLRLTGLVCPGIRWVPAPRPFTWVPAPRPFHLVLETGASFAIHMHLRLPWPGPLMSLRSLGPGPPPFHLVPETGSHRCFAAFRTNAV